MGAKQLCPLERTTHLFSCLDGSTCTHHHGIAHHVVGGVGCTRVVEHRELRPQANVAPRLLAAQSTCSEVLSVVAKAVVLQRVCTIRRDYRDQYDGMDVVRRNGNPINARGGEIRMSEV